MRPIQTILAPGWNVMIAVALRHSLREIPASIVDKTDSLPFPSAEMDQPAKLSSISGPEQAHMFQSASNISFTGGQFSVSQTIFHGPTDEDRLKIVYKMAAPNAILNAGGRADEVRCHPGTRDMVLTKSETWMDAQQQADNPGRGIFWLSGPAGAGKSAIVQTLAERRKALKLPMATFFFFRNDSTRSNAHPLVATLLTQLFRLYHGLKALIAAVLADNPLIFSESLRDQFEHLIDAPIRFLRDSSSNSLQTPIVLLIDGLDECSSDAKHEQQSLLKVLNDLVLREHSPFLILVASRPEPHLIMTFNQIGSSSASIFLNEEYYPESDIRLFVTEKLTEIKQSHHLGPTLAQNWPTNDHINSIVNKSSGQFIYAAVVIRFISGSSSSPALSLDKVKGIRPVNGSSPFAEIDAIYTYIFSQVDDWKPAKDVITAGLILRSSPNGVANRLHIYLRPLGYDRDDIPSFISELTAIVKLEGHRDYLTLIFYHASLTDFLRDQSRSGDYHIDIETFADTSAAAFVKWIRNEESLRACQHIINRISGPSLSITEALIACPSPESEVYLISHTAAIDFINNVLQQYCRKDKHLFTHLVKNWATWFQNHGTNFTDPTPGKLGFDELNSVKLHLGPGVWEEIVRSGNSNNLVNNTRLEIPARDVQGLEDSSGIDVEHQDYIDDSCSESAPSYCDEISELPIDSEELCPAQDFQLGSKRTEIKPNKETSPLTSRPQKTQKRSVWTRIFHRT